MVRKKDTEMSSKHNEEESVVVVKEFVEEFVVSLQIDDFSIKKCYIDKLDHTVIKPNNTYPRTIRMKPVNVKDNIFRNLGKTSNDKDPKLKVYDYVRISKYNIIFPKRCTPNYLVYNDLIGEEVIGTFYEKELQKKKKKKKIRKRFICQMEKI